MFPLSTILILHLDDTYFYQPNLCSLGIEVDLRNLSEIKYMCSFERLEEIEKKIPRLERSINFLGREDYHYLTYLFVRRIKLPLVLLIIDNHWDGIETFENYISCGSWILEAKKLKNVKEIIFIDSKEKINTYWIRFITKYYPVYISIDKDILSKDYIHTSWEQGDFSVSDLLSILSIIPKEKILGIDICGEPVFNIFEYKRSEKINLEILKILNESWDIKISA